MTQSAWDQDHPVLQLLRGRRESNSEPGMRSDDAQLGLAVEGGGMRGVVSASMLAALDDFGFKNAFDVVYGCSSGAINCAYFLAHDTWYPVSIYYDDLTTPKFLNLRRALVGKEPLNLDYAFNTVVHQIKPLDYQRVLASPIPLRIAITLVDERETKIVSDLESVEELRAALLASAWLPLGVKGTALFRGKRAVDGGVLTALPFRLALADSCTHILSLSTHRMGTQTRPSSLLHGLTARHLEKLRPGLGKGYIEALRQKREDQEMLRKMRNPSSGVGPFILDLAPLPETPDVKRHELRHQHLIDAARTSYEVMYAALERKSVSAIRGGAIRAVPRLTIAERQDGEHGYIRLVDHSSGQSVQWGESRF